MIQISKLKRKQKTSKIWPKSNNSTKNKNKNKYKDNKNKEKHKKQNLKARTKTTSQGGYRWDRVVYRYV